MLAPYHLRLAVRSLRRDPGLSATIVVVLAVAAGIFSVAVMHYLRTYESLGPLRASLHQVEIAGALETLEVAYTGSTAEPNIIAARGRVSYPDARLLAGSGLDAPQTATFRSRVLVAGTDDAAGRLPLRPRNVRFTAADFFQMFSPVLRWGAAWSRADEASGAAVVVLGKALNQQLFDGRDSVGRAVLIDARPFRVVGVLADEQPFSPEWDRVVTGGPQDLLYLPYPWHTRLRARPEAAVVLAPMGPTYEDLLRSPTRFISFWIDLPTPELRAAYARYLADTLGRAGRAYKLRDLPRLRAELAFPRTVMTFFVFLTFLVLAGAGLVTTRLLLAKGLARNGELAIFRALGAPRRAMFTRQLLEATLLAVTGGVVSMLVAAPSAYVYNRLVGDTDIPLVVTPAAFAVTLLATVAVGVTFAIYPSWRAASRRPTAALVRS